LLERIRETSLRLDPIVHPEIEGFWAGLRERELRVQVCSRCGTYRFPFAPVCFNCRSFDATWEVISPSGTVASAVTVHRATGEQVWASHVPFVSALVDLEHGLRLPGRILCSCGEAASRGARVRAVVLAAEGAVDVHGFAHSCIAPVS